MPFPFGAACPSPPRLRLQKPCTSPGCSRPGWDGRALNVGHVLNPKAVRKNPACWEIWAWFWYLQMKVFSKFQTKPASLQHRWPHKGEAPKVYHRKLLKQGKDYSTSNFQFLLGDCFISWECMVAEWCLIATEVKELDTKGNLRKPLLLFPWECYSFLWLETNLGGKLLSKRWSLFHSIRTGEKGYVMVAPPLWPIPSCQWPLRRGRGSPFWALVKRADKNLEGERSFIYLLRVYNIQFL